MDRYQIPVERVVAGEVTIEEFARSRFHGSLELLTNLHFTRGKSLLVLCEGHITSVGGAKNHFLMEIHPFLKGTVLGPVIVPQGHPRYSHYCRKLVDGGTDIWLPDMESEAVLVGINAYRDFTVSEAFNGWLPQEDETTELVFSPHVYEGHIITKYGRKMSQKELIYLDIFLGENFVKKLENIDMIFAQNNDDFQAK